MKILFVAVFDREGKSTNVSQILAFKKLGYDVVGYNYRQKGAQLGAHARDKDLVSLVEKRNFDLVIYSKCDGLSYECCRKINEITTTCLWWMDPLSTLQNHPQIFERSNIVDYICTSVRNTVPVFKSRNKNTFYISEGFDQFTDKPHNIEKDIDVVFIGSLHSGRQEVVKQIRAPIMHVTDAYGSKHAKTVSRSKICLNFSTVGGASDRVFKTLAAKGFLLTSDWIGREEDYDFIDGKDLVVFKDIDDLNQKIKYYLNNSEECNIISQSGYQKVQKFNRLEWAKKIIQFFKETQNESN